MKWLRQKPGLARQLEHLVPAFGGKAANLMSSAAGFGIGRQFEPITGDQVSSRLRIFVDEKDALDWPLSGN